MFSATFFGKASAQTNINSLFKIWNNVSTPDSTRLESLCEILFDRIWANSHIDSAKILSEKMHELAIKSGFEKYIIRSSILKIKYPNKKQSLALSLSMYNQCLKKAEDAGDYYSQGAAHSNLAVIAYQVGDKNSFYKHQKKSLECYQKTKSDKQIAWQLHNLGYAYQELGNFDTAIVYFNKSLILAEKIGYQAARANCLAYLGESYQLKGDYSKAQEYFKLSLKVKEENNISSEVNWTKVKIGEGLLALHSWYNAAVICQQAHDAALLNGEEDAIRYSCKCLYQSYKSLGNIKKALKYYEEWNTLNDSLDKSEMSKKLQQIDFSRILLIDSLANDKKIQLEQQAHNEEVRRGKQVRNIIIIVAIFILFFAFSLYNRLRYTKKAKSEIEIEKTRSDNLLLNILPYDVAEELKAKGSADAKQFEEVTVMFTDFKGFTQIAEKLTPTELVNEIHTCFKAFDEIIVKHNIEKIKTIGDAYMCVGGLPLSNTTHATDVVNSALEIQQFMNELKLKKQAEGKLFFEIRIGVHTGPVVAGIVGVKKFAYDIWGDTVNIASRMESSGEAGKVNISSRTYELVKDKFKCTNRGKIQAKNKGEIEMYYVESIS